MSATEGSTEVISEDLVVDVTENITDTSVTSTSKEADKDLKSLVVSSYEVQTLASDGSLVPSVIHNIPFSAVMSGNTSVQIVNSLKPTRVVGKISASSSGIVRLASQPHGEAELSKTLLSKGAESRCALSVSDASEKLDGPKVMKIPVVTLPNKVKIEHSGAEVSVDGQAEPMVNITMHTDGTADGGDRSQLSVSTQADGTVYYPIEVVQKLGQSKAQFVLSSDKRSLIPSTIFSVIQGEASEAELQDAVTEITQSDNGTVGVLNEDMTITVDGSSFDFDENTQIVLEAQGQDKSLELDIEASTAVIKKLKGRVCGRTPGRNYSFGGSRTRLRPWLERLLELGGIEGLSWVNKDEKIFRIPWKHASEGSWHADDAIVFKEYAIHSGKYPRGGITTPQLHTKWKANFRCALNSLSDIVLLREISNPRGQKAYRIYKFLDYKIPKEARKSDSNLVKKAVDDISTFTSQDAGELLVALKRGAWNLNLPADLNISSGTLVPGLDLNKSSSAETESHDKENGNVTMFPRVHKVKNEFGETEVLMDVYKEVVIGGEEQESEGSQKKMSIDKDISDLIAQAMSSAHTQKQKRKVKKSDSVSKQVVAQTGDGQATTENESADDCIKAELSFLSSLPDNCSPLSLKSSASLYDVRPNSENVLFKSKSVFAYTFENAMGSELWRALLWCIICGECFTSLWSLREHVTIHQEKHAWIDELVTPVDNSTSLASSSCLVCGLKFAKTTSMMKHLLQHSSSFDVGGLAEGENVSKCPVCVVCNKFFINIDKLGTHIRSHLCPVCNYTFVDVEKHIAKRHTFGALFQCYICSALNTSQASMLQHQQNCHGNLYAIDIVTRVQQPWVLYCTHCYQLVRITSASNKDKMVCEECDKITCSGCTYVFSGYENFIMHCTENKSAECVDSVYEIIKDRRHLSIFHRRMSEVDSQDSSALREFAEVALGEIVKTESASPEPVAKKEGRKRRRSQVSKCQVVQQEPSEWIICTEENNAAGDDSQYASEIYVGGTETDSEAIVYEISEYPVTVETEQESPENEKPALMEKKRPKKSNTALKKVATPEKSSKVKCAPSPVNKLRVVPENECYHCDQCSSIFETVMSLRRHKTQTHKT